MCGAQEADASLYKDKESGAELEVIERMPLLEWLANSYKKFGCQLEFITNKSQARRTLLFGPLNVTYVETPIYSPKLVFHVIQRFQGRLEAAARQVFTHYTSVLWLVVLAEGAVAHASHAHHPVTAVAICRATSFGQHLCVTVLCACLRAAGGQPVLQGLWRHRGAAALQRGPLPVRGCRRGGRPGVEQR